MAIISNYFTIGALIDDAHTFGKSGVSRTLDYIYCSSNAVDLSDCTAYGYETSGCYITEITCNIEYGLRCYSQSYSGSLLV